MYFKSKEHYNVYDLAEIVKILRSPEGCPWDKVQTHETIRQNFIEEVYEAVEAIDNNDAALLREELGDVLLQVVFHCVLETEKNSFTFDDVADEVCRKMIIRHPHVFGDVKADTTEQVLQNWDTIKMDTKSQKKASEAMESVAKNLPSLMRSEKLQKKANRAGFDYAGTDDALKAVSDNFGSLKKSVEDGSCSDYEKNIGNLLFSIVALSRFLKTDCEQSLYYACNEFTERFKELEQLSVQKGIDIQDLDASALGQLWKETLHKKNSGGD